jgi:hypothetical protein
MIMAPMHKNLRVLTLHEKFHVHMKANSKLNYEKVTSLR